MRLRVTLALALASVRGNPNVLGCCEGGGEPGIESGTLRFRFGSKSPGQRETSGGVGCTDGDVLSGNGHNLEGDLPPPRREGGRGEALSPNQDFMGK